MRLRTGPLAWGFGIALGGAAALLLGPHGPSWGSALAFPSVAFLLSLGALYEGGPDDPTEHITHLLRLTLGVTIGFLVATIPITLARLATLGAAGAPETLRLQVDNWRLTLAARWSVIALAIVTGSAALFLRRARPRA